MRDRPHLFSLKSTVGPLVRRGARQGAAAADEARRRVPSEPHARRHQRAGARRVAAGQATGRRALGGQRGCAAYVRAVEPHVQPRAQAVVLAWLGLG